MRNISEFFEFLSHWNHQTIVDEIREHCYRIIDTKNDKPEILFRFDIERLNTLYRISEWFIEKEFPKMNQKNQNNPDEILTVAEVSLILKVTPQTIYKRIKKGKSQKVEISTIDKPGVTLWSSSSKKSSITSSINFVLSFIDCSWFVEQWYEYLCKD